MEKIIMSTFNLTQAMRKKAFYEDGRGYFNSQTRAWQMCYKGKCDQGLSPDEAWSSCLESYQTGNNKEKWLLQTEAKK